MSTKFAQSVLKELNKFRTNPRSIQRQCELVRKGFSRIRHGDPFLKEIDYFIQRCFNRSCKTRTSQLRREEYLQKISSFR